MIYIQKSEEVSQGYFPWQNFFHLWGKGSLDHPCSFAAKKVQVRGLCPGEGLGFGWLLLCLFIFWFCVLIKILFLKCRDLKIAENSREITGGHNWCGGFFAVLYLLLKAAGAEQSCPSWWTGAQASLLELPILSPQQEVLSQPAHVTLCSAVASPHPVFASALTVLC